MTGTLGRTHNIYSDTTHGVAQRLTDSLPQRHVERSVVSLLGRHWLVSGRFNVFRSHTVQDGELLRLRAYYRSELEDDCRFVGGAKGGTGILGVEVAGATALWAPRCVKARRAIFGRLTSEGVGHLGGVRLVGAVKLCAEREALGTTRVGEARGA